MFVGVMLMFVSSIHGVFLQNHVYYFVGVMNFGQVKKLRFVVMKILVVFEMLHKISTTDFGGG